MPGVPEDNQSDQAFMTQADVALYYSAKAAGRNRVIVTAATSTPST